MVGNIILLLPSKKTQSIIFAKKINYMTCKHLNIIVTGKVQGVWFRKHTQDKALSLNLNGFVRNEPDGSVYVEVESELEHILNEFIKWLHQGSPLSKVEKVKILSETPCKNFDGFVIQR